MVTRQNTTKDRTTWNSGFDQGKRVAASCLADENYEEYYSLIHTTQQMMANDRPCNYHAGYIDGCWYAMRQHASAIGAAGTGVAE